MGVSSSSLVSISVASIGARRFSEVHGWWTEKKRVDEEDGSFGEDIVRNRSLWDDGDDGRGLAAWSRPSEVASYVHGYGHDTKSNMAA